MTAGFEGELVSAEVGPLEMDPEVEEKSRQHFQDNSAIFNVRIESLNLDHPEGNIELKTNVQLVFDKESLTIMANGKEEIKRSLSPQFPNLYVNRKTNIDINLEFSPTENSRLSCENNVIRDIIIQTFSFFAGSRLAHSPVHDLNEVNSFKDLSNNCTPPEEEENKADLTPSRGNAVFELAGQIDRLTKEVSRLNRLKETLQETILNEKENTKTAIAENDQLKKEIETGKKEVEMINRDFNRM
jgi:hypothetical protein